MLAEFRSLDGSPIPEGKWCVNGECSDGIPGRHMHGEPLLRHIEPSPGWCNKESCLPPEHDYWHPIDHGNGTMTAVSVWHLHEAA